MRDRLIELLLCIGRDYDEYCEDVHEVGLSPMESFEEMAADHLLANGVIVPPCKVGDTVYQTDGVRIYELEIFGIGLRKNKPYYETESVDFEECAIGKIIFLTRAEAEKALKERSSENAE